MKELFTAFAKHNEAADKSVIDILNGMSNDEREKERGSYYGSLSGLARHLFGGTFFFLGMFKAAVSDNARAQKALDPLAGLAVTEGKLTPSQWENFTAAVKTVDAAFVAFTEALKSGDMDAPVKVDWYGGKPPSVPLAFMLQNLTAHGIHHRGQLSQIFDELKIDNDYSGLKPEFISGGK
jgi:uncharacterized damage-inducible protein DinB